MLTDKKRTTHEGAEQNNQLNNTTEGRVLSMLTNEPQSRFELARRLRITERDFRRQVHNLRLAGHPVCTDSKGVGYWLGTVDECKRTAKQLKGRAYDLLKTAAILEAAGRPLPGQITMEEL